MLGLFFCGLPQLWLAEEALSSLTIDSNVFVFPMITEAWVKMNLKRVVSKKRTRSYMHTKCVRHCLLLIVY